MMSKKSPNFALNHIASPVVFIPMRKVISKYEITGTADVAIGKTYGIALKDEGDFVSVRLGTNELTPIGSHLHAERNFSSKEEAFVFVEELRNKLLGLKS